MNDWIRITPTTGPQKTSTPQEAPTRTDEGLVHAGRGSACCCAAHPGHCGPSCPKEECSWCALLEVVELAQRTLLECPPPPPSPSVDPFWDPYRLRWVPGTSPSLLPWRPTQPQPWVSWASSSSADTNGQLMNAR